MLRITSVVLISILLWLPAKADTAPAPEPVVSEAVPAITAEEEAKEPGKLSFVFVPYLSQGDLDLDVVIPETGF